MFNFISMQNDNGILTVTLNNPKTLNALDDKMFDEVGKAFDVIAEDDSVKVVILTGAGKAFVAGADIKAMSVMTPEDAKKFGEKGAGTLRTIEKFKKPVIAAVNGFALGGGCELAMACDIRIASTKAKFGQPEVTLGITPGFSGTQRLPRIVGIGKAKELLLTGSIISAEEANKIGLVDILVEPDDLMEKANEIAKKIASNSSVAVAYTKEAVNKGLQVDIDTAIDIEVSLFALSFAEQDQKEGMKAFLEKRTPNFK